MEIVIYTFCRGTTTMIQLWREVMLARSLDRNFVCLSVCLFVTRVLGDETKEHTADILIPHERAIILVS